MSNAWVRAHYAASIHGGKPSHYFPSCLRLAWAAAKTTATIKQSNYIDSLKSGAVADIFAHISGVNAIRTDKNASKVDRFTTKLLRAIVVIERMCGDASSIISALLNMPNFKKESNIDEFIMMWG